MKLTRVAGALAVGAIVSGAAAVISADGAAPARRAAPMAPARPSNQVPALAALFNDNPFLGGQVAPRLYRWVNDETLVFGQFDRPTAAEARALRYIGISVKGTFCAESQPGGPNGGFTHYHRLTSPTYAQGHGGPPGTNEGYWLLWVAADEFEAGGRRIVPGVDYEFSPTPPPGCAGNAPAPSFRGPGQGSLTPAEIRQLAGFFHDNPFRGGQTPPRFYRWITGDTLVYLEFDKATAARARALRYIGLAKRGRFCGSDQGHADFTSFQRLTAKTFAKGRGGAAGQEGFWHLAVAVGRFRQPWGQVTPGVDRRYFATRPPNCPSGGGSGDATEVMLVSTPSSPDRPFAFRPAEVTVKAGTSVRWVNGDDVFHTVTSTDSLDRRRPNGVFNASLSARGQTFQRRFDRSGTFRYYCQPHSDFMAGTIRVE